VKWTELSCRSFKDNAARLQLFALAYNLANFLRQLVLPKPIRGWTLTTLREKLIKIGAKVVAHAKYVTFQLAEVAVPRQLFARILERIGQLRLACASGWAALRPRNRCDRRRRASVVRRWGGIRGLSVGNAPGGAGAGCDKPAIVGVLRERIVATVPSAG
jgi:hypothetical protein